jgi:hypothetical protein
MATQSEPLKKIPGFSQNVRLNSAMRTIKLNSPICPNSQAKYETTPEGKKVRVDRGLNEQNCQMGGGKWWIDCEARGHDPYFTSREWYTQEAVYETDEQGRELLVGQRRIRHSDRRPNVVQVPLARRMHSGQGVKNSMEKKGRRRLTEAGYEEVCQLRNCQNPVNKKWQTPAFGGYCSREHMEVVAADAQGLMLPQINGVTEGPQIEVVRQKRQRMLREATVPYLEG